MLEESVAPIPRAPCLLGKCKFLDPAPRFPVRFTIFFLGFSFILLCTLFYLLDIFRYLFRLTQGSHDCVSILYVNINTNLN